VSNGMPLVGTVSSGNERKTTRPGLSAHARIAHPAGFAGHRLEKDGVALAAGVKVSEKSGQRTGHQTRSWGSDCN